VVKDRTLVDGSLVNPVPIAPTLRDITDITIAVNVSGPPDFSLDESEMKHQAPKENPYQLKIHEWVNALQSKIPLGERQDRGPIDIITRSFETVQDTVTRLKLAANPPDVVITIPRNVCRFFEFYRATELIEFGRERAEAILGGSIDLSVETV
jgi:NTE family protein